MCFFALLCCDSFASLSHSHPLSPPPPFTRGSAITCLRKQKLETQGAFQDFSPLHKPSPHFLTSLAQAYNNPSLPHLAHLPIPSSPPASQTIPMASTTFSFADEDSGSDHEHWPEDFNPAPASAVASPAFDSHKGVRMHCHCHSAPSTKAASPPPPPSPPKQKEKEPTKPAVLTQIPIQYTYAAPVNMSTHAYIPAGAATVTVAAPPPPPAKPATPKPAAVPNVYTYHPSFTEKPAEATNKWQGRTRAEVEEDNLKIAADEKVWEKRKVVPVGLAQDQMCWVVEPDGGYTLR